MAIVFPFLSGVLCRRCERILTGVKLLRRGSTRGLLSLGVIGIGPSWERRYRPAVRRFSDRLCIRLVHDPVLSRAQSAAQDTGAEVAAGLRQVIEHPGLNGILVLDGGWYGLVPVEFACACQKPLFFGGNWLDSPAEWLRLAECAQARGTMLVPELPLRFQAATTRLRELIASRLGPVRHIQLQIHSADSVGKSGVDCAVAAAVDWCSYVTRRVVEALSVSASKAQGSGGEWELSFRSDARGINLPPAEIAHSPLVEGMCEHRDLVLYAEVTCDQGRAVLEGESVIRWSSSSSAEVVEHLAQERSDAEVMLDQFCRRLVGGLIPTATLTDVAVALEHVSRLKA